jgi:hypothetical protein
VPSALPFPVKRPAEKGVEDGLGKTRFRGDPYAAAFIVCTYISVILRNSSHTFLGWWPSGRVGKAVTMEVHSDLVLSVAGSGP